MMEGLKECSNFEKVIAIQRFANKPYDTSKIERTERFEQFLASTWDHTPPPFTRVGFQEPMVVYYSSGTTGTPKAIVHAVGPLLMNGKKEGVLHRRMTPDDVALQYTTTGWIMYMSSIGHMILGGHALLYDGSPFQSDFKILVRLIAKHRVTKLGISPRWLGEFMKRGVAPREVADIESLKVVTCTGMVLPDQMFDWFYDVGFPKHAQLANISGGTDIVSLHSQVFVVDNLLTVVPRLAVSSWRIPSTQSTEAAAWAAVSACPLPCSTTTSTTEAWANRYRSDAPATLLPRQPSQTCPSCYGTTATRPQAPSTGQHTFRASRASGRRVTFARSIPRAVR